MDQLLAVAFATFAEVWSGATEAEIGPPPVHNWRGEEFDFDF